jgi:hypothetical protein
LGLTSHLEASHLFFLSLYIKKRKNRKEENVGIEKCYACLERKLEGKQQPRLFCFVTSRESTMDEDPTNGNQ